MVGGSGEEKEAEIRLHGRFGGSVVFSFLFVFTVSLLLTGHVISEVLLRRGFEH